MSCVEQPFIKSSLRSSALKNSWCCFMMSWCPLNVQSTEEESWQMLKRLITVSICNVACGHAQ